MPYRVSEPEPLTPVEQFGLLGSALGSALGRDVRLEPVGDEEVVAQMGEPYGPPAVEILRQYAEIETGGRSTIDALLDRPPGGHGGWIARHRRGFEAAD